MTARGVALGAAIAVTACGSYRSQYARQAALPGELVLRFDERLQVLRGGAVVAEGERWDGLAAVVACVPRAQRWATEATARHHKGTVTLWTGLLVGLAAVVAGGALVVSDTDSTGRVIGGLSLMAGGFALGATGGATGQYLHASANARGVDAVNVYNDALAAGARCAP